MTNISDLRNLSVLGGRLSRRGFLAGALATGALAACGSEGDGTSGAAGTGPTGGAETGGDEQFYTLIQRFPQSVQVPGPTRLPISLSTGSAQIISDGPEELGAQVTTIDGEPIGGRIVAIRRNVEPGAYYDFRPVMAEPGFYSMHVEGGPVDGAPFQISDPAAVTVPIPGQDMPPFDTPTIGEPAGVDPICTRQPEQCPFHEITLTEALATGKPVAYIIGSPAFCQTGTCAPALEFLIDSQAEFGAQFTYVHAEVYTDNTATTVAPALDAAGLTYEPVLFIVDPAGAVLERLDAVWNDTELNEALARAVA